jgi:threonine dehydratase
MCLCQKDHAGLGGTIAYISSACEAVKEHPEISDIEPAHGAHEIFQSVHTNAGADSRRRMGESIADIRPCSNYGRNNLV